ncbi:phospho-sugar glycosidase domain-containing protein [Oceanobacillus aidingensis]|uniref:Phospho-sugar glycosidase domain-containing protein n=2 Tax=Oceanobacillus TaxID=182709 RepID=A0ABV9JXE5_9BACI
MERLSEINKEKMMFTVDTVSAASDLEKEIIFHEPHYYRGDVSDYMIRSTQSRVKNRGLSFPAHHTPDIKRGDIIIESDLSKKERKLPLQARRGKGEMNLPCTKDCF